jgi:hypothetical protein
LRQTRSKSERRRGILPLVPYTVAGWPTFRSNNSKQAGNMGAVKQPIFSKSGRKEAGKYFR